MAIAAAIPRERAEIIAGGGDRLIGQAHAGPAFARPVGFFQADVPGIFSERMAGDADVLTDVDHHIRDSETPGQGYQLIYGEFLADPAEVDPHPGDRQSNPARLTLH